MFSYNILLRIYLLMTLFPSHLPSLDCPPSTVLFCHELLGQEEAIYIRREKTTWNLALLKIVSLLTYMPHCIFGHLVMCRNSHSRLKHGVSGIASLRVSSFHRSQTNTDTLYYTLSRPSDELGQAHIQLPQIRNRRQALIPVIWRAYNNGEICELMKIKKK